MVFRSVPDHIRSDNGPKFTARAVREWLGRVGARMLYIESFREVEGRVSGQEVFYTLPEVSVLTERYRRTYNRVRPHNFPGYRPPAPEALLPADPIPVLVRLT